MKKNIIDALDTKLMDLLPLHDLIEARREAMKTQSGIEHVIDPDIKILGGRLTIKVEYDFRRPLDE